VLRGLVVSPRPVSQCGSSQWRPSSSHPRVPPTVIFGERGSGPVAPSAMASRTQSEPCGLKPVSETTLSPPCTVHRGQLARASTHPCPRPSHDLPTFTFLITLMSLRTCLKALLLMILSVQVL